MLKVFPLADTTLSMIPAANPDRRDSYSAAQISELAKTTGIYTNSEDLDDIYQEWIAHQLEASTSSASPAKYWHSCTYPKLSKLMAALLSIPHSNAQSERVFSMMKKIVTDQRTDICDDSLVSLLLVKMNFPDDTTFSKELLKDLKKSAVTYNLKHKADNASTSTD